MFEREVFAGFGAHEKALRRALNLIEKVAASDPEIGALEGSLKWGQPSIATKPRTGTPIRLGLLKSGVPALFVHCQTSLVANWAGQGLRFEGARAVLLEGADPAELAGFIRAALRYHLRETAVG